LPTLTLTITIDLPEGSAVTTAVSPVAAERAPSESPLAVANTAADGADRYPDVASRIERLVPERLRPFVRSFADRCVNDLDCELTLPDSERRDEYFNVYPPPRCRRSRVAGVTYSSSRTGVFAGDIDLDGFTLAEPTYNGDRYAYPKLAQLASSDAVDEAVRLAEIAINRLGR
jgi:hypothetical protein